MKFDLPGAQLELQRISRGAHLVLLQESLRGAGKDLSAETYRYFSPGYARGSEATGVEIRSQTPADVVCELTFIEPWLRTPKAVSVLRLPFREGALLLINLHAINFTLTAADYKKHLAALSTLVFSHRGPVIVAGDFNHWNAWRASALQTWAQELALVEVEFELDWRSRHLGSSVDTIFLRGLRAVARAAFPTTRSDHNAIAASLVLLKRPSDQEGGNLAEGVSLTPMH
ncbi:MAG: endonuclease/exonuclease/phosphatase (EEP) superfamily protein YafD [Glaciecola sp.]|jgi:endonuclease/exonuclease/phosphatase (EEP) superfamily protein YafD